MLENFIKNQNQKLKLWRTDVSSKVVWSDNGVAKLFEMLSAKKARPFFILDSVLSAQIGQIKQAEQKKQTDQTDFYKNFKQFFEQPSNMLFLFNASVSEPKTSDVDLLVKNIKEKSLNPDVIIGVGGGGTMDLAKAVGICLNNPKSAAEYQGWGFDMLPGVDVWVMPTLNGTGAELTPIAVLRGPEKKLGINTPLVAPKVAIIDPQLSKSAKKFNRFYTMMDCYFHHYEISVSKTSDKNAVLDALDGLILSRDILSCDLSEFNLELAIKSAKASILGGSSSIGGRVGASHAMSYGLSNASPNLPHSVAVTISMLGLADLYPENDYQETINYLDIQKLSVPRARDYGIDKSDIEKMTKTALGMDKLWLSHFGEEWTKIVTEKFIHDIYLKIVSI